MRRVWPFLTAVGLVGLLAGVAIAGRPGSSDPFVVTAEQTNNTTTPLRPAPRSTSTLASAPSSVPATTVGSTSSVPATTTPALTTFATTVVPTTSVVPLRDRAEFRVVVANGSAAGGLATRTAVALRSLGYDRVTATDARRTEPVTKVYFRDGFEAEARRVAMDVGLPEAAVALLTGSAVSLNDEAGDVVAVLGVDARA